MLSTAWAPYVRRVSYSAVPSEMVLPGKSIPRHCHMGLAIFEVAHGAHRAPAQMVAVAAPLVVMAAAKVAILDFPAEVITPLYAMLGGPLFRGLQMKEPTRSQLSTAEAPRLELRLLYPPDVTDLDMVLLLRTLRAAPLGQGLFYGLQGLFAAGDGMILEVTASTSLLQFWALCSQMVIVNGSRALIYSDATAEHWTRTMDAVVRNNEPECAPKLRWRGSMHGGRAIATPAATTATLSAARRIGRRPATAHDNTAVISVRGRLA